MNNVDNTTPLNEIDLRYIIIHSISNVEEIIREIFSELVFANYSVKDISNIFQIDLAFMDQSKSKKLSLAKIQVFDTPYQLIREFEDTVLDNDEVFELVKTFDSFQVEENKKFLAELYAIEMKIREIYTVLARLQNVSLKNSRANVLREYRDNEEGCKKRLMNEFFFIEFSAYKDVNMRKDNKLEDLLNALRRVNKVKDISDIAIDLTHSKLRLEERFIELARIPEAIGRLEKFRNTIAHNRFISADEIDNFGRAKSIIDDVYNTFLEKFKGNEI